MSEPIQLPIQLSHVELTAELATLRQVNSEILTKRQKDKEKIAELEAASSAAQAKAAEAQEVIVELTINGPLKQLSESISTAPDAFRDFFSRDYKLELQDGVLTLLSTTDGKPVMKDGKAVPFEPDAIKALLFSTKDESKLHLYNSILIASKASGSSGVNASRKDSSSPKPPSIHFGLR